MVRKNITDFYTLIAGLLHNEIYIPKLLYSNPAFFFPTDIETFLSLIIEVYKRGNMVPSKLIRLLLREHNWIITFERKENAGDFNATTGPRLSTVSDGGKNGRQVI